MNREQSKLNQLSETLKSLSHPTRIAIVKMLSKKKGNRMTVKNIYNLLGMEQPVISLHLGILKRSGILRREKEEGDIYYCICTHNQNISCLVNCIASFQ